MNRKMLIVFLSVVFFSKPSSDEIMLSVAPALGVCIVAGVGYLVSQCWVIRNLTKRLDHTNEVITRMTNHEEVDIQARSVLDYIHRYIQQNDYIAMRDRQVQENMSAASLPPYDFSEPAVLEVASVERMQELGLTGERSQPSAQESNEELSFHLLVRGNQQHAQITLEESLGLLRPITPLHRVNNADALRAFCILGIQTLSLEDHELLEMHDVRSGREIVEDRV